MYKVIMQSECSCFTKSNFDSEKEFQFQREAYNYAHTVVELMNEDFCSTHLFTANITTDDDFVIGVELNPNAGSCGTDSSSGCGTSCGC